VIRNGGKNGLGERTRYVRGCALLMEIVVYFVKLLDVHPHRQDVPARFVTAGGNHGRDTIGKGTESLSLLWNP
jgi:hypothetical protein